MHLCLCQKSNLASERMYQKLNLASKELKRLKMEIELTVSFICVLSRATHIASSVWSSNGSRLYLQQQYALLKISLKYTRYDRDKIWHGLSVRLAHSTSLKHTGQDWNQNLATVSRCDWCIPPYFFFRINSHSDQKSPLPNAKSPINTWKYQKMHPSHLGNAIYFHLAFSVFTPQKYSFPEINSKISWILLQFPEIVE